MPRYMQCHTANPEEKRLIDQPLGKGLRGITWTPAVVTMLGICRFHRRHTFADTPFGLGNRWLS